MPGIKPAALVGARNRVGDLVKATPGLKAPHDGWLVAGSPRWKPYPCRCELGRACGYKCLCVGRTDVDVIPAHCCARRKAETKARRAA